MPQRVKNLISNRKTYIVIIITLLIGLIAAGIVIYNITKKPPTVQKTEQKAETKPKSITDPIVSGDQQKPVAPTPPQLETPKIK
jgi:flagellar basal body-associated protein FliL